MVYLFMESYKNDFNVPFCVHVTPLGEGGKLMAALATEGATVFCVCVCVLEKAKVEKEIGTHIKRLNQLAGVMWCIVLRSV